MTAGLREVLAFLDACGLRVRMVERAIRGGFVAGVRVERGELIVSASVRVSTVLHEAGHLALLPGNVRKLASGNLEGVVERMFDWIRASGLDADPDHPAVRAAMQASDPEATAWAWAAGIACGLPPQDIIMGDEYDGDGAAIRQMLACGRYIGINGLHHAGMCRLREYPAMLRWVQPTFLAQAPCGRALTD